MCQMRIRVPEQWWGDYLATLGAARVGEREILALGREVGWDRLDAYVREWFDYSEKRMFAAIRSMPAGRLTRSSRHDPFPGTPADGVEIKVTVEVDPEAAIIEVDLTDNPDCFENGLNLSEACARSAPMVGVFNSIDHTVPKNEGSFRRIRVQLRENCAVGVPAPSDLLLGRDHQSRRSRRQSRAMRPRRARRRARPRRGRARAFPPPPASISGVHDGQPFVNEVYLGCTGGAGAPTTDGWLTIMHVGNAGMCYQDSIEVDELRHPILVHARRLIPDSEGAGRFRGALGAYSEFSPRDCEMTVAYVSDGDYNPAKGVRGGLAGGPSSQYPATARRRARTDAGLRRSARAARRSDGVDQLRRRRLWPAAKSARPGGSPRTCAKGGSAAGAPKTSIALRSPTTFEVDEAATRRLREV